MSPIRTILILVAVVVASVLPLAVLAEDSATPVGSWEVTTGESRYDVIYCGKQPQICATLVWLRKDQRTTENLALLHKYVVRHARPTGAQSWTGEVSLAGNTYRGTMTMLSEDLMVVRGCSGIFCKTFELARR